MLPETLVRLSGLALMAGGALATLGWIGFAILDPRHVRTAEQLWMVLNMSIIIGGVLMAMGLPGFYSVHARQAGTLGLLGFVTLMIGIMIPYVAVHAVETTTAPNIPPRMAALVAVGAPSLFIGALTTGIAAFTAGVYPKWLAVGLVVSVLVGLVAQTANFPPVLTRGAAPAVFTVAVAALGFYTFWRAGGW